MGRKISSCSTKRVLVMEDLAGFVASEGGVSALDVTFRIANPSVLLHLTVFAFARPQAAGAADHVYTGETWQLYASTDGNPAPEIRCNPVFTDGAAPPVAVADPLPGTYEVDTGVKVIVGTIHLVPSLGNVGDAYIVRAQWEANDAALSDDRLAELFAKCDIAVLGGGTPQVIIS